MKYILALIILSFSQLSYAASLQAGNKSFDVKLSSASVGREDYTVAGVGLHYFAVDNLALGAAYEYWFSGEPSIAKGTLESTFYIPVHETIRPYFGLLYSHYFVGSRSDVDTYGYRAGVSLINDPLLFSVGVRQEKHISGNSLFIDEDPTVEFVVGLSF
ncbi:ferrodoxin oxidoreductase beta subunit [Psychromonas aquatilis]|uniref:Ferrodoxin oxidoreductase beta subunit n=1 Tax=Psychromonas aquatilis TaxID=2005072 RepID=A0ABU9GQW4_9GAMM